METLPDPETMELETYLLQETKPLHTKFILVDKTSNTCPVYFGSYDSKQRVFQALCNEIHPKVLHKWGTMPCFCRLVPRIKLSKRPRIMDKVFLCCERSGNPCKHFQWVHEAPKPTYVPKKATRFALKKRLNDFDGSQTSESRRKDCWMIYLSLDLFKIH